SCERPRPHLPCDRRNYQCKTSRMSRCSPSGSPAWTSARPQSRSPSGCRPTPGGPHLGLLPGVCSPRAVGRGSRSDREPGRDGDRPKRPAPGRHPPSPALGNRPVAAGESLPHWPARTWLAAAISAAVLVLAVAAAVRATPTALGPLIFAESLSAKISGVFLFLGTKAPLGYAFVAGRVPAGWSCWVSLLRG